MKQNDTVMVPSLILRLHKRTWFAFRSFRLLAFILLGFACFSGTYSEELDIPGLKVDLNYREST